jgi:hypothetical protein
MSSLPSSVEDELQKFLELIIPSSILLKSKIEPSIPSVKVEQVEDELQKSALDVKLKQVKQKNGYVKIRSTIKIPNQALIVKVE